MRITDLLYEYEVPEGGGSDDGGTGDTGDGGDTAATAEAPAAAVETPEYLDFDAAASLFDQRLQAAVEAAQAQQETGQEIDWNEALNPLSDEYGKSLDQRLQQRDQQLLQQIQNLLQPVLSQNEQAQVERGEQRINEILASSGVQEDARPVARDLATAYLPEMEGRYGQGSPRAAEAALAKATEQVKALTGAAGRTGGQAEIDRLAAVAGAVQTPGAAGGTNMVVPEAARTPQELFNRRFGAMNGNRN